MANSLRRLLVRRLLPAMLAILVASAGVALGVALHSAQLAYDRSLLNTALALAEQVRIIDGYPSLQLSGQARRILLADQYDRTFYAVRNTSGDLLHGVDLPLPDAKMMARLIEDKQLSYSAQWEKTPIRIAALRVEQDGVPMTVLVGETLVKRNAIVRDIVLGMLLPELLLIVATVMLLGLGIRSALAPLGELKRQLAGRSQADLSPVETIVPDEMQPLVDEINSLLGRLDRSLSSQRHFVSNAAHQLRTPVAALQAQVELALRQPTLPDDDRLKSLLLATRRLSHLIDQLLALARAEPVGNKVMPEVKLADIVRECAEIWLPRAIAKNVDLGFEIADIRVPGNALLLQELLSNLLDNAIRYTPINGAVTVGCGMENDQAWLTVDDSGPGIAAEERERVFERFYQPVHSISNGSGLGLAIVQAIAHQHGGRALAESSLQLGGARLLVRLPLRCGGE